MLTFFSAPFSLSTLRKVEWFNRRVVRTWCSSAAFLTSGLKGTNIDHNKDLPLAITYVEPQWIFSLVISTRTEVNKQDLLIRVHRLPISVHDLVTVNYLKVQVVATVSGKWQRNLNLLGRVGQLSSHRKKMSYFIIYLLEFLVKILEENILWWGSITIPKTHWKWTSSKMCLWCWSTILYH